MSGYVEGILVILLLNVVFAYAVYWPLAAGQLNLGVAGFVGVGAYLSAYLSNEYGISPYLACIGSGLVTFVFALIIAVPVLRTKGIYLALATFALGQVLQSLFLNLEVVGVGGGGYPVIAYIGLTGTAVIAAAVFLITAFLERTRFGLNMVAVHDDEAVSDLFGSQRPPVPGARLRHRRGFRGDRRGSLRAPLQLHRAPELFDPVQYLRGPVRPFSAAPRPCSARCSAPSSSPCCRRCCAGARSGATRYSPCSSS